jgi:hypothetical protein
MDIFNAGKQKTNVETNCKRGNGSLTSVSAALPDRLPVLGLQSTIRTNSLEGSKNGVGSKPIGRG